MKAIDLFRIGFSYGSNKNASAKSRIEELYSKYEKYRDSEKTELELKDKMFKAQEVLDALRLKIAGEIEKLEALKEFKADNLEKLFNRIKYAGKLKGLNEAEQTVVFNEAEKGYKAYKQIEEFLNGDQKAPKQLNSAEENLRKAIEEYRAFERKELPKCDDTTWQAIFEYIIKLNELESEENG